MFWYFRWMTIIGIMTFLFGYTKSVHALGKGCLVWSSTDGGEVEFPSYMKFVSKAVRDRLEERKVEPIRIPYSTPILKIVCDSVKKLPELARSVKGERVCTIWRNVYESKLEEGKGPADQIILGSKLTGDAMRNLSAYLDDETVELVYKAVSDLGIHSLRNAYAFEVMLRAVYKTYDEISESDRQIYNNLADMKKISFLFDKVLERESWAQRFSADQFGYIKKHLTLHAMNRTEMTVCDYILSLGGSIQNVSEDGYVDLGNKMITSLVGLDLIQHKDCVRNINLSNNIILGDDQDPDFPVKPFELYPYLETLELHHNRLSNIPEHLFCGMKSLKYLSMSSNEMRSLHARLFHTATHLRRLDLSNNQISEIPDVFFSTTNDLRELYLFNNKLVSLPACLFDATPKVEKISLGNNKIVTIERGLFRNLYVLYWLDLTDNGLFSLSPSIFEGLHCLTHLYLSKNQIAVLEKSVFHPLKNLQLLDLSHNQVGVLSDELFCKSMHLISIDLSNNKLHCVSADVFRHNKKLLYLNLDSNFLRYTPKIQAVTRYAGVDITDIEKSLELILNSLNVQMEKKSDPC